MSETKSANWYTDAIAAKWNEPNVKAAMLTLIDSLERSEVSEDLPPVEDAVFGPRVECPHGCGSMNLRGAPTCWGCEEGL